MKKQILFLALSMILGIRSFSQTVFENGYFINDSNQKIDCLIKNIDWKNNPKEIQYMLFQDTTIQKVSIENVKEFAINNVSKYIRAKTNIDRSSNLIDRMSSDRNPSFKEEQLFLKVLIEGKASLFLYEDGNLTRFFYNLNDSGIKQLVYKHYLIGHNISINNYFRQQLLTDLTCQAIDLKDVEHLNYSRRDLEQFFIRFNECTSSSYINFESRQKKDLLNLSFRPGLNYSSLEIQNSLTDSWDTDFGNNIGIRFGIEAEFILPFNNNKWGIITEPTYQYFNSEKTEEKSFVTGGILISKVNYKSIELPVGVRHYFFINNKSKVFADISYIFDFSNNSEIHFTRNDGSVFNDTLEIKAKRNFGLELGYKFNDKYSFGIKYHTSRKVFSDYLEWSSKYNTFSIIFGYTLF